MLYAHEYNSVDHELEASAGDLVVNITLYDDHIECLQNIKVTLLQ